MLTFFFEKIMQGYLTSPCQQILHRLETNSVDKLIYDENDMK